MFFCGEIESKPRSVVLQHTNNYSYGQFLMMYTKYNLFQNSCMLLRNHMCEHACICAEAANTCCTLCYVQRWLHARESSFALALCVFGSRSNQTHPIHVDILRCTNCNSSKKQRSALTQPQVRAKSPVTCYTRLTYQWLYDVRWT